MTDWPENDHRVFCGNLSKEVTDDMLAKSFMHYKSFAKAKVIRDKNSGRTRGYGFVSFRSPDDFLKALKEMDGQYVGTQPVKLKKSKWQERQYDPEVEHLLADDFGHFRKKKENENSKFIYGCRY